MTKRYFQLAQSSDGKTADLDIYGDICASWWDDSATDAVKLSQALDEMGDVDQINVHINSYGGEVAEGLAIYTALRRHKAHVTTTCDGFACSIASVIFMAGDERIMSDASLLMVHNAWTDAFAVNAADLRKLADDMDTITQASKAAYMSRISISEDELAALMDAETWIAPDDAVDMGFATSVEHFDGGAVASQGAREALMALVLEAAAKKDDDEDDPEKKDGSDADSDDGDDADGDGDEPEKDEPDTGDGDSTDDGDGSSENKGDSSDDDDESEDDDSDEDDPDKKPKKANAFVKGFAAFAAMLGA